MDSFRVFLEESDQAERMVGDVNAGTSPQQPVWSAKKSEILQMWRNLRPDQAIIVTPMSDSGVGQEGRHSYGEDGIRITGSWPFISSVLGRLKDLMSYENSQTKMRLIMRGVDKSKNPRSDRNPFVFYFNLENRGSGKHQPPTPGT